MEVNISERYAIASTESMQAIINRRPPTKAEIKAIIECEYMGWVEDEPFDADRDRVVTWVKGFIMTVHEQSRQPALVTAYQQHDMASYCIYCLAADGTAQRIPQAEQMRLDAEEDEP